MSIEVERALAAKLPGARAGWGADDAILYHLALGAAADPTDPGELAYVYEGAGDGLRVLPSYATIPGLAWLQALGPIDGLPLDRTKVLHGEQEIELRAPLRPEGEVETGGRIVAVHDKGSGALVVYEAISRDAVSREVLFVNRFSSFVRDAGGFGGARGPASATELPQRPPEAEVVCPTLPQQALLYRLTGDRNPMHADPAFAARGGFERPILHGLCTYGIACKAAIDAVLGGDPARVAGYRARFAGVVFPGETLLVRLWWDGEEVRFAAFARERGTPVIDNATITLRRQA